MSVMAVRVGVDPAPLTKHLEEHAESTFDEALRIFKNAGLSETQARDEVWQLLSQGVIEFTTDRRLRLPTRIVPAAAG